MLGGLVAGKAIRQTGLGGFVAQAALVPTLARTHGRRGAAVGLCVVTPMVVKRALGNRPPSDRSFATYARRVLFDADDGAAA